MGERHSSMEGLEIMAKNIFADAFRGKDILITGHTGFKGGWLALWLESLGAKVTGYSLNPPTKPSFFESVGLKEKITHINGDIRNLDHLTSVVDQQRPEYVFHLAAQPLVRRSYRIPIETFEVNVMGTLNVLESVRRSQSVKACVCITSDKCYENQEWVYAYRENDPMGGYDPYSASKGAAELAISSYRRSFLSPESGSHTSISSVRAGNVMGGGDWAEDRIIPDCVRAITSGKALKVRNPLAVRPWQHVLDPLAGYLMLAAGMGQEAGRFSGAWNFGPFSTNSITVERLVDDFIKEWGSGHWENVSDQRAVEHHEAGILRLDCTKANYLLGWLPIYSIDESIKETASWYRAFYSGERDMYDFTIDQIESYNARSRKVLG
jgi:CDP-glucose 4,6-dehydratase